ncbi:hypothetical protein POX_d05872 [Penicillium oxalicum]|uniref:hypothetical protein n=1 Tax=Penicillium oxalicum TaxID=69781 RepID=UPI0020B68B86|nr:hypothetical protein POX_d05872 [Penicillium oxalicum]KAI2790361.1 hypothetical protein POX_d05872 [Penicillium oxalicum]
MGKTTKDELFENGVGPVISPGAAIAAAHQASNRLSAKLIMPMISTGWQELETGTVLDRTDRQKDTHGKNATPLVRNGPTRSKPKRPPRHR